MQTHVFNSQMVMNRSWNSFIYSYSEMFLAFTYKEDDQTSYTGTTQDKNYRKKIWFLW